MPQTPGFMIGSRRKPLLGSAVYGDDPAGDIPNEEMQSSIGGALGGDRLQSATDEYTEFVRKYPQQPKISLGRQIAGGLLANFSVPLGRRVAQGTYPEELAQFEREKKLRSEELAALQRAEDADRKRVHDEESLAATREYRAGLAAQRDASNADRDEARKAGAFNRRVEAMRKGDTPYVAPPPVSASTSTVPEAPTTLDVPGRKPEGQGPAEPPAQISAMPVRGLRASTEVAPPENPEGVSPTDPVTGERWRVRQEPRTGMIAVAKETAQELGLSTGRDLGDGTVEVSKTEHDKKTTQVGLDQQVGQRRTEGQKAGLSGRDLEVYSLTGRIERPPTVNVNTGGGGQSDDAKAIAQAIREGRQAPTLTHLYRMGGPVRAELARSGYDLATAQRDWDAVRRHLSTMNGPQQERLRQAITFTYDSLDVIENLFEDWKREGGVSGLKDFNRANLAISKRLPGKAGEVANVLEAQINDLTSEMGTVYKGGNASTDESLRLAAENLKAEWNEGTFKRAVATLRKNLELRKNSIYTSSPVGVSGDSPYLPKRPASGGESQPTQQGSGAVPQVGGTFNGQKVLKVTRIN